MHYATSSKRKNLLVTGGAGFIGSAFIRYGLAHVPACARIVNLDLLTYAANRAALSPVEEGARYRFVQGDICDEALIAQLCREEEIDAIVHFAAESHVDRSIADPKAFYRTNVEGTLALLEATRTRKGMHFHQVSTDEVYGTLQLGSPPFSEESPYRPNSPYAASKAAADHFVRAYGHTYDLSYTLSHCTNNYGPYQHAEKFIPRMIASCVHGEPLPIYGTGRNVRDWIFVDDHVAALWMIVQRGERGQVYDIGGGCEIDNLTLAHAIIECVAQMTGESPEPLRAKIRHVPDRPGHDLRYAICGQKMAEAFGWKPEYDLAAGLKKTVQWYLQHSECLT